MPAMELQNSGFHLKGYCTRMILEEDCLLVVARKTFAPMVMVVIAVVVACLDGFYMREKGIQNMVYGT
jgi:hypothetical protein